MTISSLDGFYRWVLTFAELVSFYHQVEVSKLRKTT